LRKFVRIRETWARRLLLGISKAFLWKTNEKVTDTIATSETYLYICGRTKLSFVASTNEEKLESSCFRVAMSPP
jgi:hypothetical protein